MSAHNTNTYVDIVLCHTQEGTDSCASAFPFTCMKSLASAFLRVKMLCCRLIFTWLVQLAHQKMTDSNSDLELDLPGETRSARGVLSAKSLPLLSCVCAHVACHTCLVPTSSVRDQHSKQCVKPSLLWPCRHRVSVERSAGHTL